MSTARVVMRPACWALLAKANKRIGRNRSNLWQGVLMDHAKTGYFDMPARGGNSELPDEVVSAAAEYMLEMTFPDRLED